MPMYRARSCPNCNHYFGFTVAKPPFKTTEFAINGACFNCGYKIPMHALLLGKKRAARPSSKRRPRPNSASVKPPAAQQKADPRPAAPLQPPRYATDLRAIGQQLETLQVRTFNLECVGASYVVYPRKEAAGALEAISSRQKQSPLRTLWNRISGANLWRTNNKTPAAEASSITQHRYDPADIARIDREGRAMRKSGSGITDGHRLSQLLRTLGTLVSQRGQKLVAISWQDVSIGVVVETATGQRGFDLYRHENIYDFWVKCYLRRASRAYLDVPS
jgi:hypothetical protein